MTAPLQPATRRLLTEATAAATYRTAAQVDTAADARADAAITAQKGVASGLASLGADGKVPSGQLPAAAAGPLTARLSAAFTTAAVGAAAAADITGWQLDGISVGLFDVEFMAYVSGSGGGTFRLELAALNGLVATAGQGAIAAASPTTGGRLIGTYFAAGYAATPALAPWTGGTAIMNASAPNSQMQPMNYRGLLNVTTAGSLKLRYSFSNAATTGAGIIDPGSFLRLTKLS